MNMNQWLNFKLMKIPFHVADWDFCWKYWDFGWKNLVSAMLLQQEKCHIFYLKQKLNFYPIVPQNQLFCVNLMNWYFSQKYLHIICCWQNTSCISWAIFLMSSFSTKLAEESSADVLRYIFLKKIKKSHTGGAGMRKTDH